MKLIYGSIFKELRINKGLSLKEISDPDVSIATISKFENGTAMISVEKFFKILSNINVSPGEYFLYIEDKLKIPYSISMVDYFEATDRNRIVAYEKLLKEVDDEYEKNPNKEFLKLQSITLKSMISQYTPGYKLEPKEINYLKQYLLTTKLWNEFELRVYSSSIHLYDPATVELLTARLLAPLNFQIITPDMQKINAVALINLTNTLVVNEQFDYCEKIVKYLSNNPLSDKFALEKPSLALILVCITIVQDKLTSV